MLGSFKRKESGTGEDMDDESNAPGLKRIKTESGELVVYSRASPPKQARVKLIPSFNITDVDRANEIAELVQSRTAQEAVITSEQVLRISPKSNDQEEVIRKALQDLGVEFTRCTILTAYFLITGLPVTTLPADISAELIARGVALKRISQVSNDQTLLPLFMVYAPRSQAAALQQIDRLCDRKVQIQVHGQCQVAVKKKIPEDRLAICRYESQSISRAVSMNAARPQLALMDAHQAGGASGALNQAKLQTLSFLRELKEQIQALTALPDQVKSLLQGGSDEGLMRQVMSLFKGNALVELLQKLRESPTQEDKMSVLMGALD